MALPSEYSLAGKKVWVAGHRGMAGSAIVRRLQREDCHILTADRSRMDLRSQAAVEGWMAENRPDAVVLAAATVGGIHANNTRPAEFLYDNLVIETNIIHSAWRTGVGKLLFLGSSCIYPRAAEQPMREEALLTGPLEPTNEWYAIAKISGIKMCQAYRRQYGCDFISLMPTNLFGLGDRYDLTQGHVVAALIMKIHAAKLAGDTEVVLWGTGTPKREFLFSEDLADACVFAMKHYSDELPLNIGNGKEITILELATKIAETAGWTGHFTFDTSKPDGSPRKVMDVSRLTALGWTAKTEFAQGMAAAYEWYVANSASEAGRG
ncbi:MAG: GDP-L-fucose synthase [Rhodospirillaceae bacterium]|nr:GDP-L-fucose synthase [Rhodospirillales bacterium]